jgi:hypothetical protein
MSRLLAFWRTYGKAIVATAVAVFVAVHTAISDHHITNLEGIQIATAAVTAVGVWLLPEHPEWTGVKTAVAVGGALLAAMATVISQGMGGSWPDIVIGALTVLLVGGSPARSLGATPKP